MKIAEYVLLNSISGNDSEATAIARRSAIE